MPVPPPVIPPIPGTQATANDIIRRALRMIGALQSGENPTASEAKDSIEVLNQMLDAWNAESLTIFTRLIEDFTWQASKQTYTLGTLGDFDTERPARIERMSTMVLTNPSSPLEVPIDILNDQEWQSYSLKLIPSTFPLACYDDGSFPFRNLSFWPIPQDATNYAPRLYSWAPLSKFPDLATIITFPPGYYEAIIYNLAPRLAPEFAASTPPEVAILAMSSKAIIKAANADDEQLACDWGVAPGASPRKMRNELFNIP